MPLHGPIASWIFAGSLAAATACLAASWFRRGSRPLAITGGGFLAVAASLFALAVFPELIDSRYRAFRSLYHGIREGMNRSEVDALVRSHYPLNGQRTTPAISQRNHELHFHMNPEHLPEPNSELFTLVFQPDGRVASKSYSAD